MLKADWLVRRRIEQMALGSSGEFTASGTNHNARQRAFAAASVHNEVGWSQSTLVGVRDLGQSEPELFLLRPMIKAALLATLPRTVYLQAEKGLQKKEKKKAKA